MKMDEIADVMPNIPALLGFFFFILGGCGLDLS